MVRVRIAPAPTGALHVGTARTALFNWLFARKHGGEFLLRIEDTDKERSKPEFVEQIIEGLKWLGLEWDEGPFFQSERLQVYRDEAYRLLEEGKAYLCFCTPEELEERRRQMLSEGLPPRYDRRCRYLNDSERKRMLSEGRKYVLRFAMPTDGETKFYDLVRGEISVRNEELDDFVILKSDGTPTYNFACVVDDHEMRITHVIRGEDHIPNTPRQIWLYAALGYEPPQFAHLPLLLGQDRSKLSKRHGATSLLEYRDMGILPEAMFNFLALLGWSPGGSGGEEIFSRDELIERFEITQVKPRQRGIPDAYDDYRRMLERNDIHLIDVCTPNHIHKQVCIEAAQAGKHIVCEKPLTGYFGEDVPEDVELIGHAIPKRTMFEKALANAQEIKKAVLEAGVKFTYAENWVYAPPIQKAKRLLEASGGTVLFIRAEESHSGSASPFSFRWRTCGGGALLRLGSHPIGAVLYLKQVEGVLKHGKPILPKAVYAQVSDLTQMENFKREERHFIVTGWMDVENWSMAVIDFDDGSKAVIFANDCCLGGIYDRMEIYASNCRIQINMNPNDTCVAYAPSPEIFADEYIAEKLETKAGWTFPSVNEDFLRGYPQEMQDAVMAVLDPSHQPLSGIDLAVDVVRVIYAGYVSAEEGVAFNLS